jgi:diguanylate cyclase (GGDEF)-like protein/hemerythrin-like metal-binding protein
VVSHDKQGKAQRMIGTHTDITERKRVEEALEESNRKLEALSATDGLTGIANRRHFDETLVLEHARHARTGTELSLILLDIDYFKAYNDNYGHVKGDECLRQIAGVIADCAARPADLAARYGGEEFACILPETDRGGAVIIAERIRRSIQALGIPHKGSSTADCVTASLGVVTLHCTTNGLIVDILAKVDELLYRAKSSGRNRVEFDAASNVAVTPAVEITKNLVHLLWKDSFRCGNQLIDSQHRALFHVSNELLDAALSDRPSAEISALISRLIDDIRQHFHDEELILEAAGFPNTDQHAAEHAQLLAKGIELSQQFNASTLTIGYAFQFLVHDVVMAHMLGADREFFSFILEAPATAPHS